ncbi:MAG: primosomal protein N' [Syntrophales bacterium]|nr:primosomal protein N' [Syntrophales bacterium]
MGYSSGSGNTDVKFAHVALNIPTDKTFVYIVPPYLKEKIKVGSKVLVPFGPRQLQGYVVSIDDVCEFPAPREILTVIGDETWFDEEELSFYSWIADYYLYPLGKVFAEIIPSNRRVRGAPTGTSCSNTTKIEAFTYADVKLNDHQQRAFKEICEGICSRKFCSFLLHGSIGSGKTELHIQLVREVLKNGGGIIYLVPEIGFTPYLLKRIKGCFPDEPIALFHSGVSRGKRASMWSLLRNGEVRFVLGTRSALFAPVRGLRLLIVEEEHDESYKQDAKLCYNARDLAIQRARLANAVVVLSSATPSVESYFQMIKGEHGYFFLPPREDNHPLPEITIVDMRRERKKMKEEEPLIISNFLFQAIRDVLNRGKQVLLLLNRRGFHTVKICRMCNEALRCNSCSSTLTFHADNDALKCHYCSFSMKDTLRCPYCSGGPVVSYGYGTELLEAIMRRHFPHSRIVRMDRDTVTRRAVYDKILLSLERGEIDILIGTQMVVKEHDFSGVVLVGVVSADTALNLPDFRASERTFQLLGQVVGMVGREAEPARVVIQTFNPEHYTVKWIKHRDFSRFFEDEIAIRESLNFPPFSRLIQIWITCPHVEKGAVEAKRIGEEARKLADTCNFNQTLEIIGPAEAPIFKLRGRYRWHMLLKGNSEDLHLLAKNLLAIKVRSGVSVKADVDPISFL